MKICQVGTGFVPVQPDVTGGAEKYVHHLSEALQYLGHKVTVIDMPTDSASPSLYRRLEVPLRWRYRFNVLAHSLRGLIFGWEAARLVGRLIEADEVDLVSFHSQFTGATGIPVARKRGVPTLFTMHNPLWSDARACQNGLQRAKFWLERRSEMMADAVIGLSQHVTDHRERFFGLRPAKSTVVPVAIDDSWFQAITVTPRVIEKYASEGEPLILVVGRLARYKNQLLVAKALPRLLAGVPKVRVVFAGPLDSLSYLRDVQAAVAEAHAETRVIFAGALPLEELAQLFPLAQAFVLPSLQENCPQVLLEAMAQGKAIVASDIAPVREMLPEGTAVLVPPTDPDALASAVLRLLDDETLRGELGFSARQRAHDVYRWEVVARRAVEAYREPLSARTRQADRQSGCLPVEG